MSSSDGSPERTASPCNGDAERQRRRDALRDLAGQTAPAPLPSATPLTPTAPRPSPASPFRRGPRLDNRALAGISVALCLAVIAAVAFTRLSRSPLPVSSHGPTGPVFIRLGADHMSCMQDAAWSPGGNKIAVFDDSSCAAGDIYLNIFDAASGKLTAQTDLTSDITPALQSFAPQAYSLGPILQPALWTTQGLYIPFTALNSSAKSPADFAPAVGLLAFDPRGVPPLQPTIGLIPNPIGLNSYVRWDSLDMNSFTTSDSIVVPAALVGPAPAHTVISSFPPALAYQMAAFPLPQPLIPLSYRTTPAADAGGTIGNPAADNQITIWQPGTLTYFATIPGTATPASIVLFDTSFAAVQPPPFLDTGISFEGRLVPPDQPAPDVNALARAGLLAPWLPIRDSALAYVLTDLEHSAVPGTGPASIAWRPDGTRLAYQPGIPIGGGSGPRAHDVRIYDCHTGQVLVTLTPPLSSGTPIKATNLLRWSPDGTKLLLLDRITNQLIVWGKGQLPA